jgi:pimeloyl-ACP methyl ester carboxylesterase
MDMNTRSALNAVPTAMQPDVRVDRPGYFVAGAGKPLVMLHSSLSSKSQWGVLAERLARRFRVIAIDLCGYGDNAGVDAGKPFTLDDEVRLITTHLDKLVPSHVRVHLVGHSYGGLVALRFAQSRRGRIASLALYDPVVFRALHDDDAALAEIKGLAENVAGLVMAGKRSDAAQAFVDFWGDEGSFASLPVPVRDSIARRVDKVPLDFQAAVRWPLSPVDLRVIAVPTLLLAGARSPTVVKRIVTSLNRELPNRRVRWIDAGHMGPITHAHRVNPWIETFVDLYAQRDAAPSSPRADIAPALWAPATQ